MDLNKFKKKLKVSANNKSSFNKKKSPIKKHRSFSDEILLNKPKNMFNTRRTTSVANIVPVTNNDLWADSMYAVSTRATEETIKKQQEDAWDALLIGVIKKVEQTCKIRQIENGYYG